MGGREEDGGNTVDRETLKNNVGTSLQRWQIGTKLIDNRCEFTPAHTGLG